MLKDKINILYRTEKEAVIYKPAGIATELSNDIKGTSLKSILKKEHGFCNIYFPHRLDRITSGLLLAALDKETVRYYNEQIKNGGFDKYYTARVEPDSNIKDINSLKGTHKAYIKYGTKKSSIVRSGGKPSLLEILETAQDPDDREVKYVLVKLLTGRKHQIRVMLAGLSIPLCGDFLYNSKGMKKFYLESVVLKFKDTSGKEMKFNYAENPDRPVQNVHFNILTELI